jgi:hypothetical protein
MRPSTPLCTTKSTSILVVDGDKELISHGLDWPWSVLANESHQCPIQRHVQKFEIGYSKIQKIKEIGAPTLYVPRIIDKIP